MASHGRLPQCSGSATEWDVFAEQLSFVQTTQDTRCTRRLLTFKSFAELVKLAQDRHNPKPSVIMRRFHVKKESR